MNMKKISYYIGMGLLLMACGNDAEDSDAYGNFEVDETTISAEVGGELLEFDVEEGDELEEGEVVGLIDTTDLHLSRLELKANRGVIESQYQNLTAEVKVLEAEKANIEREIQRTEKMLKEDAATQKQLDDLRGARDVVQGKIMAVKSKNPSIFNQLEVLKVKLRQIDDKVRKAILKSPSSGVVLNKIANQYQLVMPGAPLYTMADLSSLDLRAYVSGDQLSGIQLGQEVEVLIDGPENELKAYTGKIKWISDEAEFTPKIIQTRKERVDMVYAIKVRVQNDGSLKIGMPGEVRFAHAKN